MLNLIFDLFTLYDRVVFESFAYLPSILSNVSSFRVSFISMDCGFLNSHGMVLPAILLGSLSMIAIFCTTGLTLQCRLLSSLIVIISERLVWCLLLFYFIFLVLIVFVDTTTVPFKYSISFGKWKYYSTLELVLIIPELSNFLPIYR